MENVKKEFPRHDRREDMLLVIDFQNVYLPGRPWACPAMEQAAENTLKLIGSRGAPEYVVTKYMPPENPTGCWVRYNEEYADINADEYLCDFCDAVKPIVTEDNLFIKDSYSSMDCEKLQARLAGKKRVVLTGVVAECCVLATMMDAIDQGYEVIYLYDCIAGNTAEHEKMIRELAEFFSPMHTRVMKSREYLASLSEEKI